MLDVRIGAVFAAGSCRWDHVDVSTPVQQTLTSVCLSNRLESLEATMDVLNTVYRPASKKLVLIFRRAAVGHNQGHTQLFLINLILQQELIWIEKLFAL